MQTQDLIRSLQAETVRYTVEWKLVVNESGTCVNCNIQKQKELSIKSYDLTQQPQLVDHFFFFILFRIGLFFFWIFLFPPVSFGFLAYRTDGFFLL